jgi:hypothetical protein
MLAAKSVDVDVMLNEFKIARKQPSAPKKSTKGTHSLPANHPQ